MRALLSYLTAVSLLAMGVFVQVPTAQALPLGDIVFMIDESGSMGDDINDVKNNVNAMATQLGASVDFQLGLIGFGDQMHFGATFSGQEHIHQTLTSNVATFQNAVNGLTASGGHEPGFSATVLGMSAPMGFRPGAGVCAIIITDEDADSGATKAQALAALNARNATFFGIINANYGNSANDYGPNAGSLSAATGGQTFDLIAFRANPQPVLTAMIAACAESITTIVLVPPQAQNYLGQVHTVTATMEQDGQPVAGTLVSFEVTSGPNAGEVSDPGECSVNADCTTDAAGLVSWGYTGAGGVGTDQIEACFVDNAGVKRCSNLAVKDWVIPPCEDPAPNSQGFWRRVCKKDHPDQLDRSILTPELCEDLNPDPNNSSCEKARSQCAALSYSVISDRIQVGCVDTITGSTVGDTAAQAAALIAEGTNSSCKQAQALCASVNEGNVSVP